MSVQIPAAQLIQLDLQRRWLFLVGLNHFGDATDLSVHPGLHDDAAPAPVVYVAGIEDNF